MKERPILFSAPMVRAILSGQKTQTRRVVKGSDLSAAILAARSPYGQPGDRLWVRETLRERDHSWVYDADGAPVQLAEDDPRVPQMISWAHHKESDVCVSIHMPRWASRITLEITETHAERLHQITDKGALAEGVEPFYDLFDGAPRKSEVQVFGTAREAFADLWASINGAASWDANPWVWVVSFRRLEGSP